MARLISDLYLRKYRKWWDTASSALNPLNVYLTHLKYRAHTDGISSQVFEGTWQPKFPQYKDNPNACIRTAGYMPAMTLKSIYPEIKYQCKIGSEGEHPMSEFLLKPGDDKLLHHRYRNSINKLSRYDITYTKEINRDDIMYLHRRWHSGERDGWYGTAQVPEILDSKNLQDDCDVTFFTFYSESKPVAFMVMSFNVMIFYKDYPFNTDSLNRTYSLLHHVVNKENLTVNVGACPNQNILATKKHFLPRRVYHSFYNVN